MPYSPDMAPMDYAINANLKTNLKRRVAHDRGQMVSAVRYEWSKIKILTIRRALKSWRTRVETTCVFSTSPLKTQTNEA